MANRSTASLHQYPPRKLNMATAKPKTELPYELQFRLWLEERRLPSWHSKLMNLIARAETATIEDIRKMQPVAGIARKGHMKSPHVAPLLAAWIKTGVIWGDELACADAAWMTPLAVQAPEAVGRVLAQEPRWHEASSGESFEHYAPVNGLASSDWGDEAWLPDSARDASLNFGWAPQFLESQSRSRRQQSQILEWADTAGRLETLMRSPRGATWLMHCLVSGHPARAQQALDAGLRLDAVPAHQAERFLSAFWSTPLPRIDGQLAPREGRGPASAAQIAARAGWKEKEREQKERRLAWALAAGFIAPIADPASGFSAATGQSGESEPQGGNPKKKTSEESAGLKKAAPVRRRAKM